MLTLALGCLLSASRDARHQVLHRPLWVVEGCPHCPNNLVTVETHLHDLHQGTQHICSGVELQQITEEISTAAWLAKHMQQLLGGGPCSEKQGTALQCGCLAVG